LSQEIAGTIEGDEVKLRSDMRRPGNGITFIFSGKVEGEAMSGTLFLGEYLKATFSAERSVLKGTRRMVAIPGGQPLAT